MGLLGEHAQQVRPDPVLATHAHRKRTGGDASLLPVEIPALNKEPWLSWMAL